jgi:hypothetical protein
LLVLRPDVSVVRRMSALSMATSTRSVNSVWTESADRRINSVWTEFGRQDDLNSVWTEFADRATQLGLDRVRPTGRSQLGLDRVRPANQISSDRGALGYDFASRQPGTPDLRSI